MTPERWRVIKEIFQTAIEQHPSGRRAFLNQACADDVTLIPEIESLLDVYQHLGGFLEPKSNSTAQSNIDQQPKS